MLTGRVLASAGAVLLFGAVVGVIGTGVHRAAQPWGLVLALATVASAAVLARAWAGGVGVLSLALGVFVVVGVMGGPGPGGDVVIALQPVGVLWYLGGFAVVPAALLPQRWFRDEPVTDL